MQGLEGLGADVTTEMINGLLLARAPRILDEGSEEYSKLVDAVSGAVVELVPLVGTDPAVGPRRALAVRAVSYLAASEIESALFPEQQGPGDAGRAGYLSRRYQELRRQLADMPAEDPPSAGQTPVIGPAGCFPPPPNAYPDPAELRRRGLPCSW